MTDKLELKPVLEQPADPKQALRATQENFRLIMDWVRKVVAAEVPSYSARFLQIGD